MYRHDMPWVMTALTLIRQIQSNRGADKSLARPISRCILFDG